MPVLRLTPPLLATLLLACAAPPAPEEEEHTWDSSPRPVRDAEGASVELANDRDWLDHALGMLRSAEDHVEVAQFLIVPGGRVDRVLDALEAAADRGVACRVIADEASEATLDGLARLEAAGCETRLDSPARTTHLKLLIADDQALLGSHNLTDPALGENVEASVRLAGPAVSGPVLAAFEEVWAHSEGPVAVTADPVDGVQVVTHQEVLTSLLDCLDGAQEQVAAMIYAVAWDPSYPGSEVDQLLTAVEAAHVRGVSVRMVVDGSPWSIEERIDDETLERLGAAGVPARRSPGQTVHHAKVLRCDDRVIVGDANWSYSGLALYSGVSVVLEAPEVVEGYGGWLDAIWEGSQVP